MKIKSLSILILAGLMTVTGCGRKAMMRRYYVLALTPAAADSAQSGIPLPNTVDVRDFTVARAVDQTRIALRTDSHEMNYYFYHHWAVRPGAAVADFLHTLIADRGMFTRLTRGYSATPQFVLSGSVNHMERLEKDNDVIAHLGMTLELVDMSTNTTVAMHRFDRELPVVPSNSMNAFAAQISRILQEEGVVFCHEVETALAP